MTLLFVTSLSNTVTLAFLTNLPKLYSLPLASTYVVIIKLAFLICLTNFILFVFILFISFLSLFLFTDSNKLFFKDLILKIKEPQILEEMKEDLALGEELSETIEKSSSLLSL